MKRIKPDYLTKAQWKRRMTVWMSTAVLAASLTGFAGEAEAAQPHSSYWYPNTRWNGRRPRIRMRYLIGERLSWRISVSRVIR